MKNIYKITWKDPESESEWMDLDGVRAWAKKSIEKPSQSVGWIALENPKYLIICGDKNSLGHVGSCTLIYKSLVVKKEKL